MIEFSSVPGPEDDCCTVCGQYNCDVACPSRQHDIVECEACLRELCVTQEPGGDNSGWPTCDGQDSKLFPCNRGVRCEEAPNCLKRQLDGLV
jgi:hypothetical protein